ncbi:MAG: hypothetical protein MRY74_11295 [Neomegalonema sp.]|nr:hypothetical protein [Neomegalonema sp.]
MIYPLTACVVGVVAAFAFAAVEAPIWASFTIGLSTTVGALALRNWWIGEEERPLLAEELLGLHEAIDALRSDAQELRDMMNDAVELADYRISEETGAPGADSTLFAGGPVDPAMAERAARHEAQLAETRRRCSAYEAQIALLEARIVALEEVVDEEPAQDPTPFMDRFMERMDEQEAQARKLMEALSLAIEATGRNSERLRQLEGGDQRLAPAVEQDLSPSAAPTETDRKAAAEPEPLLARDMTPALSQPEAQAPPKYKLAKPGKPIWDGADPRSDLAASASEAPHAKADAAAPTSSEVRARTATPTELMASMGLSDAFGGSPAPRAPDKLEPSAETEPGAPFVLSTPKPPPPAASQMITTPEAAGPRAIPAPRVQASAPKSEPKLAAPTPSIAPADDMGRGASQPFGDAPVPAMLSPAGAALGEDVMRVQPVFRAETQEVRFLEVLCDAEDEADCEAGALLEKAMTLAARFKPRSERIAALFKIGLGALRTDATLGPLLATLRADPAVAALLTPALPHKDLAQSSDQDFALMRRLSDAGVRFALRDVDAAQLDPSRAADAGVRLILLESVAVAEREAQEPGALRRLAQRLAQRGVSVALTGVERGPVLDLAAAEPGVLAQGAALAEPRRIRVS